MIRTSAPVIVKSRIAHLKWIAIAIPLLSSVVAAAQAESNSANKASIAVGPQYCTTHVYVAPADFDPFVNSFIATFGGSATKRIVTNVLPVPSSTEQQAVLTPVGLLSIFAFQTPIPYPFGEERTGYLVADMDMAIKSARETGAEVVVEPFKDPIGMDTVIQWPGGVKMQLYMHFRPSTHPPLETIPENRVYLSKDQADNFVRGFVSFAGGKVISDDTQADAGEIGRSGEIYRRISITSGFGKTLVIVTDGHLPYPFGRETTGYEVKDLNATLQKAKAGGVKVLFGPYNARIRKIALLEFPGGYIAEVHGPAM